MVVKPEQRFPVSTPSHALKGGLAPGCWRREVARMVSPLQDLRRICAWMTGWASFRPCLRNSPLWGKALELVTEAEPQHKRNPEGHAKPGRHQPHLSPMQGGRFRGTPREIQMETAGSISLAARDIKPQKSQKLQKKPPASKVLEQEFQAGQHLLQRLVLTSGHRERGESSKSSPRQHISSRIPQTPPLSPLRQSLLPQPSLHRKPVPPASKPYVRPKEEVDAWRRERGRKVQRFILHASKTGKVSLRPAPDSWYRSDLENESLDAKPPRFEVQGSTAGIPQTMDPWHQIFKSRASQGPARESIPTEDLAALASPLVPFPLRTAGKTTREVPSLSKGAPEPARRHDPPVSQSRKQGHFAPSNFTSAMESSPALLDRTLHDLLEEVRNRAHWISNTETSTTRIDAGTLHLPDKTLPSKPPRNKGSLEASKALRTPFFQGGGQEGEDENLLDLADRLQRILQEQARRHGIDV